jgi:hypothetical protein
VDKIVPNRDVAEDTRLKLLGLPQHLEHEIVRDMVNAALKDGMIELVWADDRYTNHQRVRARMFVGKLGELEGHREIRHTATTNSMEDYNGGINTSIHRF